MPDQAENHPSLKQRSPLLSENRDLAILYVIAGYLNHQVDVHKALQEVLSHVTELLALQTGWVWVFDEQGNPIVAASRYLPPYLANHPSRMSGSCQCLDTYTAGSLEHHPANVDVLRCSRLKNAERDSDPSALGLRFHASVPIYAGEELLGVMNVASEDWRELRPDELQLLHIISDQIGLALQRAHLSAEHTRAATRLATIEERNRLAREIHDTLAQGLSAIALQLETADALAETRPQKAHEAIQRALLLARGNLEEARRSVMDLRAAPLQEHTLPEALATLASSEDMPPVEYSYTPALDFPALPARIEAGLYRIAQEALTNIRKHAHAQKVFMKLVAEEEWISFIIQDDGHGFDPDTVIEQNATGETHFGLAGMSERARLLGGHIYISSAPESGTSVEVSVPY